MCAKDILEEKCDKMCEMKEEIRKVVVGSNFFSKEKTKVTLITLMLALEPFFFFALKFLQNDRLNISLSVVFILESQQQQQILRTLGSGTNILQRDTPQ